VERSSNEVAWLRLAGRIVPGAVPAVFGEDKARHMFTMEYYPPEEFPVWKTRLAGGTIEPDFAADAGRTLARIHAATAGRADIAAAFANDTLFLALRLDPFFLHVARKHPDIAKEIRALADGIATARIALMQGDISPKNILRGPRGPVFLDAETACYGDPAFDLAFCLTQLLLKCVWHPQWTQLYLQCFSAMATAYCAGVVWEAPSALDERTARLLPALLLARIDGKSPVEYLTEDEKKNFVRGWAVPMLKEHPGSLDAIPGRWASALAKALPQRVHR
jgi:5-methylthioribose kinase